MEEATDINIQQVNPIFGLSILLSTFLIGFFLYSGRAVGDCAIIAASLAMTSLGVVRICVNCRLSPLISGAAGMMFTFSPFIMQLAILNTFSVAIVAIGIWSLIPWVGSMAKDCGKFSLSFLMIVLPGVIFAAMFTFFANPAAMDAANLKTFFPLPISEYPYPAFAQFTHIPYTDGIPVSVGYLMLVFALPGLYRITFEALLVCIIAAVLAVPGFDKPFFQIPPSIWMIFPVMALAILSANGVGNLAGFIEKRFGIRPVWVFFFPVAEIFILAYIITY